MLRRFLPFVPFLAFITPLPASAQPLAPPPPAQYDVQIRFQIDAKRNERISQYYEMVRDLRKIGFVRDPNEDVPDTEPENPRYNRMSGTIATDRVPRLLAQRHIRTIQLKPSDVPLPPADQLVRVHLDLVGGLEPERQRTLYQEARAALLSMGFQEGVGYDTRRYTRLVGSIPVKNLDALLLDFRRQPRAWQFLSKTLLTDLRAYPGGQQVLEDIVTEWYGTKVGKKLVVDTLELWRLSAPARELIRTLPVEIGGDPQSPILRERLLIHLLRSPDAEQALARLLANVFADKEGADLVESMMQRIEGQGNGGGMPVLFRGGSTLRVIEVLPQLPLPAVRPIPQPVPQGMDKFTPDLRELAADEARAAQPLRIELIYALTPSAEALRRLAAAQDLVVEGQLGPVVTVTAPQMTIRALTTVDEIAVMRLPRLPQPLPLVPQAERKPLPLTETGIARLHALGHRGKGTIVAVIDPDFRAWDVQRKENKLPKGTRLLDLTRERHPRMEPDQWPGDPQQLGVGTRYAMTLVAVAPEVELLLVRIDPRAPYMIQNVARTINGEGYHSFGMEQRFASFQFERGVLDERRDQLLKERRAVYSNFDEEGEPARKREEYRKKQAQFDRDEADYAARLKLYLQLQSEFNELKNVRVAVSSLVWNEGFPVDGSSPLSRYFDDRPFKAALWFQAGGDTRGQAWTGLFRDEDSNGAMEFAEPKTPLAKGQWSHEYDYVKWQAATGEEVLDLPANVKLRLSVQWREAHDPFYLKIGEDRYREPLARLRLVLVQQLDPTGQRQPSDDLQVIAESVGLPERLYAQPNSATYEQTLEVRVPRPGRYAVRIEGRVPEGVEPRGAPVLPLARQVGELKPRLFVQTLEGPGRVVLDSYWTDAGSLGMPADARQVIAVGPVNNKGERQPYGSRGPAQGIELQIKPDVLAYDENDGVVFGSGQAAAFAAGVGSVSLNCNAPMRDWLKGVGLPPGSVIRLPEKGLR